MDDKEKEGKFEEIIEKYSTILHATARRELYVNGATYDWSRAEEAVQEALAIAWTKRDEVLASKNIPGWLGNTLRYVMKNMTRQDQQWKKQIMLTQKDTDRNPIQPPPGADLELEGLVSAEEYTLLRQVYVERIPYEELCQVYGIKKSALAMRVKRAKERFREAYLESEKIFPDSSEQTGLARHNTSRGGPKR